MQIIKKGLGWSIGVVALMLFAGEAEVGLIGWQLLAGAVLFGILIWNGVLKEAM